MKLTIKGDAPKGYDEIINHEDGTKWIRESAVIEILKGLQMKTIKTRAEMIEWDPRDEGYNKAVSEQNSKIQAVINKLEKEE